MKPYGRTPTGWNLWPLVVPALSSVIWFFAGVACASVWVHWQAGG